MLKNDKQFKYIVLGVLILVFAILFYWFTIRDGVINKKCNIYAVNRAAEKNLTQSEYEIIYKVCVRNSGDLKGFSIEQ